MYPVRGSQALVRLFENEGLPPVDHEAPVSPYAVHAYRQYGNIKMRKPRALTISSATSTTFLDKTYRGRFPCGQYHRTRIIQTTLRKSLPPNCARAVTEPSTTTQPPSRSSRLDGIKRIFSLKNEDPERPKATLKPFLLANSVKRLSRSKSSSAAAAPADRSNLKANLVRRLSLGNWVQSPTDDSGTASVTSSTAQVQLRPLVLPSKFASLNGVSSPAPGDNANVLAWILECIQLDIKPQIISPREVDDHMLLHDGQPRCLVVRAKRRSALF
ncbi:hypothetical protein FA15DRAFT_690372 [Coprinopsis marcescibilis]|uniref:Uncharacterized protein n=1 Tax=Coprinopsis marcescibilis TaxID=230819 RepID=A0A5C3LPS0_COPMA|nr:hypothetical protein FA15DRAFT_690372 [Coprinopsis marcescibilis]